MISWTLINCLSVDRLSGGSWKTATSPSMNCPTSSASRASWRIQRCNRQSNLHKMQPLYFTWYILSYPFYIPNTSGPWRGDGRHFTALQDGWRGSFRGQRRCGLQSSVWADRSCRTGEIAAWPQLIILRPSALVPFQIYMTFCTLHSPGWIHPVQPCSFTLLNSGQRY